MVLLNFLLRFKQEYFFMFSSLLLNVVRTLPVVVSRSNPTLLVAYSAFYIGKEVIAYIASNDSKSKK